jgi:hypothetical protein
MRRNRLFATALLIGFLATMVVACNYSEKPESDDARVQRNTGVTNSSAATAGLLKPVDLGDKWYDANVDQFPGPESYKGLNDCAPVLAYQSAVQKDLSAESQISIERLAGDSKPQVSD